MYIQFNSSVDLLRAARGLDVPPGHQVMIWVADGSSEHLPEAIESMRAEGIPFFGGIFPGLIFGPAQHSTGAILQVVPVAAGPYLAKLAEEGHSWVEPPADLAEVHAEHVAACILVDCLAPGISPLLTDVFHRFGDRTSYFGAGCGTSELDDVPVVFCNGQPIRSAAIFALLESRAHVGVRHGWSRTGEPIVATRTRGNVIEQLNWEPALSVYTRALGTEVASRITHESFFTVTGNFPFGIDKEGTEDIVRDPIRMTDDGRLVCLSNVPEHSVMHVLSSDRRRLLGAAADAVRESAGSLSGAAARGMVVDCFSRALLMGDEFDQELQVIQEVLHELQPGLSIEGVLALGEIASDGTRLPEFHNKTIAVGLFDA